MKPYLVPALGVLMLTACSNASDIKNAVRNNLIDPDSVQFGELIEYTDKDGDHMACIMVNAKNRMGGYTGEKMFLLMNTEEDGWQGFGDVSTLDCADYVERHRADAED